MAAAEVPVLSESFTQIKEQKLKPGDQEKEKEEGRVQRMGAQECTVEVEAEFCQLLDAGPQKDQPELPLWVPVDDDRQILTLQTLHLTSQDVHLQGLGWLGVPHSEGFPVMMPQAESFLPLPSVLWLEQESQPSLQHCVAISIPEELCPPEELERTHFHLLWESVPVAEEDQELMPDLGEGTALMKVCSFLPRRCLVGERKVNLIFLRSRLWMDDIMYGQDNLKLESKAQYKNNKRPYHI